VTVGKNSAIAAQISSGDQRVTNWIGGLCETLGQAALPIVGYEQNICITDPPSHENVGDSATILLGKLHFLQAEFPRQRLSFYDNGSIA